MEKAQAVLQVPRLRLRQVQEDGGHAEELRGTDGQAAGPAGGRAAQTGAAAEPVQLREREARAVQQQLGRAVGRGAAAGPGRRCAVRAPAAVVVPVRRPTERTVAVVRRGLVHHQGVVVPHVRRRGQLHRDRTQRQRPEHGRHAEDAIAQRSQTDECRRSRLSRRPRRRYAIIFNVLTQLTRLTPVTVPVCLYVERIVTIFFIFFGTIYRPNFY